MRQRITFFIVSTEKLNIFDNATFHLLCTSSSFLIENPSNFLRSRKSEVGSRKSEVGSRNPEVGTRKSEVGSRNPEVGSRKSEPGSRNPEVGTRNPEVGSWKLEVGSRKSEVGSRKSEVGSRKSEVGSRKSEVGSRKSEVSKSLEIRDMRIGMKYMKSIIHRLETGSRMRFTLLALFLFMAFFAEIDGCFSQVCKLPWERYIGNDDSPYFRGRTLPPNYPGGNSSSEEYGPNAPPENDNSDDPL
ncbi:hypothetical protein CRE_22463 [Caenorhabditis remanei]|uniref:Uncharacterized protein n=1 Tax=Caenorhabditis remanei TaxID=31234 RepID=E3MEB3_CAERE|nr:hypothetical protein CRE_22463 [Caenorhabditis remanei]